jgi:hypothetical protein
VALPTLCTWRQRSWLVPLAQPHALAGRVSAPEAALLRKVAAPEAAPEEKDDVDEFASGPIMPNRPRTHDRKIEQAARKRHERLVEQWKNIRRLYLAGADLKDICRQLGISACTVYRQPEKPAPAHFQGRAISVSPGARQNRLALRICVTGPAEIRSSDESPGASPRRPEGIVTPATRPSRDPGGGLTRRRSP